NIVLAEYLLDRANITPTTYEFIAPASGLYPMRLFYWQGQFGGNVEFYSINRTTGVATLINAPGDPNAIKTYPALAPRLTNVAHSGHTTTFNFLTEGCRAHRVE